MYKPILIDVLVPSYKPATLFKHLLYESETCVAGHFPKCKNWYFPISVLVY